jgi:type IV pilus assembly protein PilW
MCCCSPPARQHGVTLTELLVGLALGLLVTGAIIQLLLSARESNRTQTALTDVQENGRGALWVLSERIRLAGYDNPATPRRPVSPALRGTDDPDTLQITYEGGDDIVDCRGQAVPQDTVRTERLEIVDGELRCSLWAESLVDGISDLHILYGLDTDLPADGIANRFVNATEVGTAWGQVTSVRLALLAATRDEIGMDIDVRTLTLLDDVLGPFNDRRLRTVFSTTVQLRN